MRDEAVAISDSLCCAGADLLYSETVRSCKVVLAVALMLLTSGAKLINTAEEKMFETCAEKIIQIPEESYCGGRHSHVKALLIKQIIHYRENPLSCPSH